jgi:putative (di)nucleoside polyphosphate hydrolase
MIRKILGCGEGVEGLWVAQMAGFRPNVALLLVDSRDRLLICERLGAPGSWQFPQGGVDKGEEVEAALLREVQEEVGLPAGAFEILASKGGYRYVFPQEVLAIRKMKKRGFEGQEQTYYLCRMRDDAPPINIEQEPREFQDFRWIDPKEFQLEWLPEFKREVYRAVMRDFFEVKAG